MNKIYLPLALLLCATLSACSSKEQLYEKVYEGLHARERIVNETETANPIPKEHPRYDEYQQEREEILKSNKSNDDKDINSSIP